MVQTAIWIPPSLCGCQLSMTAEWTDGSVVNGISYRHPKDPVKDTSIPAITNLQIVSVCPTHQPQTLSMIDTSIFFDTQSPQDPLSLALSAQYPHIPPAAVKIQNRGYLHYPIANPTPAECLYTFLTQYRGQSHHLPCGCKGFQWVDEKGNASYMNHPLHKPVKCNFHTADDINMAQAHIDCSTIMKKIDIASTSPQPAPAG